MENLTTQLSPTGSAKRPPNPDQAETNRKFELALAKARAAAEPARKAIKCLEEAALRESLTIMLGDLAEHIVQRGLRNGLTELRQRIDQLQTVDAGGVPSLVLKAAVLQLIDEMLKDVSKL